MKKFIAWVSLIFVLIVGVITSYVFNVDAQKVNNEVPVNETVIEEPASQQTPSETETDTVDTVLANNSWETIAKVFKAGNAEKYWKVGDIKEVELSDGFTYEVRIADMHHGRYAFADGTGRSNGVFEFVKLLSTDRQMNSTNTNVGGWAACSMRRTLNDIVYNQLPEDLKSVISEVFVASGVGYGTTSGVSYSQDKLFLASEYEVFGVETYSIGMSEGLPQFGYWALHNSIAEHIKTKINELSATWWWLRSPNSGNLADFCVVGDIGTANRSYAHYSSGVCPCFAF